MHVPRRRYAVVGEAHHLVAAAIAKAMARAVIMCGLTVPRRNEHVATRLEML